MQDSSLFPLAKMLPAQKGFFPLGLDKEKDTQEPQEFGGTLAERAPVSLIYVLAMEARSLLLVAIVQ